MNNKNAIIGWVVIGLVVVGAFALVLQGKPQEATNTAVYSNPEIGLEFSYSSGPAGYVVQEAIPMAVDPTLVRFVHVVPAEVANQTPPEGGEGPAQIVVGVYKNTNNEWSKQWAETHPQYSNINLKQGEVADVVVGGANAARFTRDGLYPGEVVVVAHGGLVYVFDGAYPNKDSALYKDFSPLIDSVRFVPIERAATGTPASAGKLNIDEVCQGALAYMSFPSGAEADTFVAECKQGKHPEVIEKYKADHGLTGAAI